MLLIKPKKTKHFIKNVVLSLHHNAMFSKPFPKVILLVKPMAVQNHILKMMHVWKSIIPKTFKTELGFFKFIYFVSIY